MASRSRAETLPEGVLACDRVLDDGQVQYSLTGHAFIVMQRYADAEGLSFDVAAQQWTTRCWVGWVRSKLLEHFLGWRRWSGFKPRDFGLLRRESVLHMVDEETMQEVIDRLGDGGENLDIIDWAVANGKDIDGVIDLLDRININDKRRRLLTSHIQQFLGERTA